MLELIFLFIVVPRRIAKLARARNRSVVWWSLAAIGAWIGAEFVVGLVVMFAVLGFSLAFGFPLDPDRAALWAYIPALIGALVGAEVVIRRLRSLGPLPNAVSAPGTSAR